MTMSQLRAALDGRIPIPHRPVVITFDDGFADTLITAAPLLAARHLVATVYLTTGAIGAESPGGDRMLDWSQVHELAAAGHEVGAHTHRHPELDMVDSSLAQWEIAHCKRVIEDNLGVGVGAFAYPFGYSSPAVRRMVAETGYSSACCVKNALSSAADSRFQMPRLTVGAAKRDRSLALWLAGSGAPIGRNGERAVSRAWGLWRWTRSRRRTPPVWTAAKPGSSQDPAPDHPDRSGL